MHKLQTGGAPPPSCLSLAKKADQCELSGLCSHLSSLKSFWCTDLRKATMTVHEKTPAEEQRDKEREMLPSVTLRGLHDAKRHMKAAEYRGKQHIAVR